MEQSVQRPESVRRTTHPADQLNNNKSLPVRPRTHVRSRSYASALTPMARVHSTSHSFPSSPSRSPSLRPSSPMRSFSPATHQPHSPSLSPYRPRSPLDEPRIFDGSIESISEDAELDITPRSHFDQTSHSALPSRSLSMRRQRPSSPLHSLSPAATPRSSSGAVSPSVTPTRFNEGFPALHHYSSTSSFSSSSTTPSSARSRSPSISSLETIEDAPDLEWEAIEADRANKLRAVAEAAERGEDVEPRRRGSLEIPGQRSGVGFGFGRRGGDANRKRWSICGGERRADLDLETIWED